MKWFYQLFDLHCRIPFWTTNGVKQRQWIIMLLKRQYFHFFYYYDKKINLEILLDVRNIDWQDFLDKDHDKQVVAKRNNSDSISGNFLQTDVVYGSFEWDSIFRRTRWGKWKIDDKSLIKNNQRNVNAVIANMYM